MADLCPRCRQNSRIAFSAYCKPCTDAYQRDYRARRREQRAAAPPRERLRSVIVNRVQSDEPCKVKVPVSAILDRARRFELLAEARPLIATLCGDPLPGYSALDRKGRSH